MPARLRNRTAPSATRTAVELHGLANSCAEFPDRVVDVALPAIGAMMKEQAFKQAQRAAGGDRRLSRMGRRGVTLGAGYDNVGPATVRLTPRPLGAWTLVESGSDRSHWFEPRAGKAITKKGTRRTNRKRLKLRNGAVRWYVRHPSVAGKRAWSRARTFIHDELPDVVHTATIRAWQEVR